MIAYRVFPYAPEAAADESGGPLYVPPGGTGRIDNPELYRALYLSSQAEGAVAETFGRVPIWSEALFTHPNGSRYALGTYRLSESLRIYELDNAAHLETLGIRPSDVVRRDSSRSQGWARTVFSMNAWDGISWWSFYGPQWNVVAVWSLSGIEIAAEPLLLNSSTAVVRDAAASIVRVIRE